MGPSSLGSSCHSREVLGAASLEGTGRKGGSRKVLHPHQGYERIGGEKVSQQLLRLVENEPSSYLMILMAWGLFQSNRVSLHAYCRGGTSPSGLSLCFVRFSL